MNKYTRILTVLVPLVIFTGNAQANESPKVLDQGLDGDVRYYRVICPSGKRTTASFRFKTKEVCAYPIGAKNPVCRQGWSIDKAAKDACK